MLRVLLVDDEPFILRGMKELIDWEDEGFEIVGSADDGEEALLFLQNHDADLILSDIKMPIMTGIQFVEKANKELKHPPIFLVLSGYDEFTYVRDVMKNGAFNYLLKPIKKDELKKPVTGY